AEAGGAIFPLTPALSLGERENRRPRLRQSKAPRLVAARDAVFPLPEGFLLPTISCSFPMANFPHQRQVIEALEPAPERDRTGFAIAVARPKAAQLCRPPDELAHRGRFSRRTALAKSHTPQRLPFRFAEPITGRCVRRPPRGFSHGHQPPGA